MIKKHTEYLLPHALTPSGTSEQSSNFWASTLQYRILFFEALRRVTGRDLFAEHPDALPGRIGLAAVAGGQVAALPEAQYSIWNVLGLALAVALLGLAGVMMTDLIRNMWSWNEPYTLESAIMEPIISLLER